MQPRKRFPGHMSEPAVEMDAWLPPNRSSLRVDELGEFLSVTNQHLYNLIIAGELRVPKAAVDSAPSRASIMVPRAAIVAFLKRRTSLQRTKRNAECAKKPASASKTKARQSEGPKPPVRPANGPRRKTRSLEPQNAPTEFCNAFATREQRSK